ncbi:MAG: hypothetical protein JXA23_07530 [Bacteroidales bacterium]|nr:hypothetical protein [Bacteroidales bacterium]
MKNRLESYIESNRDRLDLSVPDDDAVWKKISGTLDARKRQAGWIWKAAAVLLVLLSVGSVSIYSVNRALHHQPAGISLNDISKELGAEEILFRQEVYRKMDQVKNSNIDPTLSVDLYRELHQIDIQYDGYLADLQQLGDNPKVIRGMIRCYEQKIRILEQTIREIEKSERYDNKTEPQ